MRPLTFLICSLAGFLVLLAGYALVIDKFVLRERSIPFSYRQFLLESSGDVQGKVVVDSGSNAIHGIDTFALSKYFHAPVVIVADGAGYPLRKKIFRLKKYLREGDVLILPLEWNQYSYGEVLPTKFVTAVADEELHLAHYISDLPIAEKLRFILTEFPLSIAFESLLISRSPADLIESDYARLGAIKNKLALRNNESYGGSERDGPEKMEFKSAWAGSCDGYLFAGDRVERFSISRVFRANLTLLRELANSGIAVYFTWPSVVDSQVSTCYSDPAMQEDLTKYSTEIMELVESKGFQFIGQLEDSHFTSECFLNTYYHLRRSCAENRTNLLIDAFKRNGASIIDNSLTQSDLNTIVKTSVQKAERHLKRQLVYLRLPPIAREQITGKELGSRIGLLKGWSRPESWGVWSLGAESELVLKVGAELLQQEIVTLGIKGRYFNGEAMTKVEINGKPYGAHILSDKSFSIPVDQIRYQRIIVRLWHSNYASPLELGKGEDERNIKFALEGLSVK